MKFWEGVNSFVIGCCKGVNIVNDIISEIKDRDMSNDEVTEYFECLRNLSAKNNCGKINKFDNFYLSSFEMIIKGNPIDEVLQLFPEFSNWLQKQVDVALSQIIDEQAKEVMLTTCNASLSIIFDDIRNAIASDYEIRRYPQTLSWLLEATEVVKTKLKKAVKTDADSILKHKQHIQIEGDKKC